MPPAGFHHMVKEAAGKRDSYPRTYVLHPRLEEARGWLAGSPNVSGAAAPREKWGVIPIAEDMPQVFQI
eukprot:2864418-Pyramimonas_sp.AAC.1